MRVSLDDTGVDREGLASQDTFLHAERHHRLEQLAQETTLAEATVAILENVEWSVTSPSSLSDRTSISQIEMDLRAQPTLRANAEAIADDEHSDHQLGIDRRPPDVAIIGPQVLTDLGQVDEPTDGSLTLWARNR
jgi:hypothetical protein